MTPTGRLRPKALYFAEAWPYRGLAWYSPVGVPSSVIFHAPMIPSGGTAPPGPSDAYVGSTVLINGAGGGIGSGGQGIWERK
jgi:NADPH:quinone reductase-like Zn-dependent oxidoreductase